MPRRAQCYLSFAAVLCLGLLATACSRKQTVQKPAEHPTQVPPKHPGVESTDKRLNYALDQPYYYEDQPTPTPTPDPVEY